MTRNSPVKALNILAHLSISLPKSPVTGQKCSVPNLFSAISFTLPPMASDHTTDLSIAFLPHIPPLDLILDFHVGDSTAVGVGGVGVARERRGGGSGGSDMVVGV
jgi:hypothetical protein